MAQGETSAQGGGSSFRKRVFTSTTLAIWTRQLAGLVSAGLPLERALTAMADEAEDPRQRELVAHLRSEVNAGSTFARALSGSPREFDEVYRGVVAAGEQSGQLGTVLEKLATDLEEQQALRSKLIGATLYPAIVSVFAAIILLDPHENSYCVPLERSSSLLAGLIAAYLLHWGWGLPQPSQAELIGALLLVAAIVLLAVAPRHSRAR